MGLGVNLEARRLAGVQCIDEPKKGDLIAQTTWPIKEGVVVIGTEQLNFQDGEVYQIGKEGPVVYQRANSKLFIFKSQKASWLVSYSQPQLVGEVVRGLGREMVACPFCGRTDLSVEVTEISSGEGESQFMGAVICHSKKCGADITWKIPSRLNQQLTLEEALAFVIARWNARGLH